MIHTSCCNGTGLIFARDKEFKAEHIFKCSCSLGTHRRYTTWSHTVHSKRFEIESNNRLKPIDAKSKAAGEKDDEDPFF